MACDGLPRYQQRAVRQGLREVGEIRLTALRTDRRAATQQQVAAEAQAAGERIIQGGGITALAERAYKREQAAMLARLRRHDHL